MRRGGRRTVAAQHRAVVRELLQVRGGDLRAAVHGNVAEAQVVAAGPAAVHDSGVGRGWGRGEGARQHEDDVWLLARPRGHPAGPEQRSQRRHPSAPLSGHQQASGPRGPAGRRTKKN